MLKPTYSFKTPQLGLSKSTTTKHSRSVGMTLIGYTCSV